MEAAAGRTIVIISPGMMWDAVDALVEHVGPDQLRRLNFRAGEHLAAILTTSFLGITPAAVDTAGGADLVFDCPHANRYLAEHITKSPIAFEIKSIPGPYRRLEYEMDNAERRDGTGIGTGFVVQISTVEDILNAARPEIERARKQLEIKASSYSQNAFIIAHIFDHLPVEFLEEPAYGPHLSSLVGIGHLETVWILWDAYRMTLWSVADQEWLNLMFSATEENEEPDPRITGKYEILQEVEIYFMSAIGETKPSPYLFSFTSSTEPEAAADDR